MAKGFKHGARGGSALNFRITGSPEQPESPRKNDIWIQTDRKITGWAFSAQEPEAAEGAVWISTGTESNASFNAVRKEALTVCPTAAAQNVDGAWVSRNGYIFDGAAWVGFGMVTLVLYENGDPCAGVTGGWTNSGWTFDGFGSNPAAIADTYMQVKGNYNGGAVYSAVGTADKVSLRGIGRIYADIEIVQKGYVRLSVCETKAVRSPAVYEDKATVGSYTYSLDVSELTGDYYIVADAWGTSTVGDMPIGKITRVWAEP